MMVDKIFYNGKIYSIDDKNQTYEAVGIKEGKIVFLGSLEEALKKDAEEKVDPF